MTIVHDREFYRGTRNSTTVQQGVLSMPGKASVPRLEWICPSHTWICCGHIKVQGCKWLPDCKACEKSPRYQPATWKRELGPSLKVSRTVLWPSNANEWMHPAKHKICASLITRNVGPPSKFVIRIMNMDSGFLPMQALFFRCVEPIFPLTMAVALCSCLPWIARYRLPGDCMKISLSLFSIFRDFPSSLDKALIEKLMFVQIGLLCTLKCALVPLWNMTWGWKFRPGSRPLRLKFLQVICSDHMIHI